MPRKRTGQVLTRDGRWFARVTLEGDKRRLFELAADDEASARARTVVLADLAADLERAGQGDLADAVLTRAAKADAATLATEATIVEQLATGKRVREGTREGMTFKELATKWTSGELARDFPDHVKAKGDVSNDVLRLRKHVLPHVGAVPIARFTLDHADAVMRALSPALSSQTRRHVANLMHRLLGLAVFPLRLREANPLPKGWLPRVSDNKAKAWLYPDEESRLMGCEAVPLASRVLYGVLAREGLRRGEAIGLTWSDLDLDRGAVTLDENKTDDPRAWALGRDVVEALTAWHALRGEPAAGEFVFAGVSTDHLATELRDQLRDAGVDRPQLFERTANRQPVRVHDLRGTFVTLALATGKSEAWVSDRTGHKSSAMINRYKRAARTAAELGLGWLAPLADAIPELKRHGSGTAAIGETGNFGEKSNDIAGAPSTIRTYDPRLRRPMLYPAELWALADQGV